MKRAVLSALHRCLVDVPSIKSSTNLPLVGEALRLDQFNNRGINPLLRLAVGSHMTIGQGGLKDYGGEEENASTCSL